LRAVDRYSPAPAPIPNGLRAVAEAGQALAAATGLSVIVSNAVVTKAVG
jgi:hypothetical protein